MAERLSAVAAVAAGVAVAAGLLLALWPRTLGEAAQWLDRRGRPGSAVAQHLAAPRLPPAVRGWLSLRLERAGWSETPHRFLALAGVASLATAAAGGAAGSLGDPATSAVLALVGAIGGVALALRFLGASASARRRRLLAELAPTLELACLELTAGTSVAGALNAVTRRTDGELAREVRLVLASAALGSGLDAGLRRLGERLDLSPLTSVAAVVATSRDYGSGVVTGLRAIALDLRRAQRRDLIATSRSALTRVLVPAAAGVLMPFLAILLYPAVVSLAANLR